MMHDHLNAATLAPGQHYEPEELMSYALEMLSGEDRRSVDTHLTEGGGCATCNEELTSIRNDLGLLAVASVESVELQSAPVRSRDRLMAEVAKASSGAGPGASSDPNSDAGFYAKPVDVRMSELASDVGGLGCMPGSGAGPATGSASGSSFTPSVGVQSKPAANPGLQLMDGGKAASSRGRITAWIGWAVAAGMAIAATHFYQERETLRASLAAQAGQIAQLSADQARARGVVDALTDRGAQRVTLTLTKAPAPVQPMGRATYLANKGTLIFLASHMEQLPAGKTYELWVIPASGAAPVPAGTFRPDERGNASVVTARLQSAGVAKAFGVTIEAASGSTTPTMPILLAGS